MKNFLEISQVSQYFRSGFWMKPVWILQEIDLFVPQGSIFGFLGANGAGKTTLIHLIIGIRKPKKGSVQVLGFDACSVSAKEKIGYLPERPYFHEHLTGEKLLEFYGTLSGMKRADLLSRIPAVLKAVGMSDARKLELKHYSKGMLQRIGIAQAILHDPPCLVLDEPMSGLDPQGRKEIQELLLQFASEGRTLFFSSHHFSEVKEMCNHLAIIRKGRLIASGSIQMYPNLETLFLNEWVKKEGDR